MSRRSTFLSALGGVVVGALMVGVVPAVAGVGDPLVLGQNNNGGNKTTKASANVSDGPGFQFTNPAGGVRAAVRINTDGLAPPFATNSTGKVKKFNADLLDDKQGTEYQVIAAGARADEVADPSSEFVALDADITVPTSGTLMITATSDTWGYEPDDFFICVLRVDGIPVPATEMANQTHYGAYSEENCTTSGLETVDAGTHTVDLYFQYWETLNNIWDTNLSVIFIPGTLQASAAFAQAAEVPEPDTSIRTK